MNIVQAIKYVKFKDVARALKYFYPEPKINKSTMKRYEEIMKEIGNYKSKEIIDCQLDIGLVPAYKCFSKSEKKWIWLVEIGDEYYSTNCKHNKEKQTYAIEFTRWEESSQWKIRTDSLKHYTLPEIIAHYLWEITFCGYTQTPIQKHLKEIHRRIKQVKNNPDKYTVPIDLDKLKNFGK
jgi:hypothetical protein